MSNDKDTTDTPAEAPKDAAPARVRKIVRRSAATRDNPSFAEAPPLASAAEPAAAAPAQDAAPQGDAPPAAPKAPAAAEPTGGESLGPRARATFDARAPRPRPAPGAPAEGRPRRPRPAGEGDYRPPPPRPMGARPIPGGSRAPAPEGGEGRPRRREGEGDYRPPPPRPMGARPLPGGSRAPAPSRDHDRERPHAHEGGKREGAPSHARPPRDAAPKPAHAPKPAPAKVEPPPPPPKAAPKPAPVFIPLARAGQVAPASAKPALTPKEALAAKTKAHAAKVQAKPAAKPAEAGASFDQALVSASADDAIAAIGKAGEGAAALVDAWAAANNAAAVAEVAEAEAVPGAVRKAARRALNVLRSRGVAIPVKTRTKVEERVETEPEAQITPPDTMGTVVLSFTRREPSGRYHMAEILVREPFGVLQAWGGWLSGSQLKEGRNRQLEGYGIAPVTVPLAWARHRVAHARKLNATSGQVMPLGLDRCLDLVDPAPEAEPAHPVADLEAAVTSERVASAAAASGMLHAEPEFRGWLADRRAIEEMLYKVGERLGPGQPEGGAVDAAVTEEVAAATDRYFSPEARALLASRMRDAAISVRARKGDAAATDVLAVARAVTEAGLITSPPREIPFLLRFFELGLRALAAQTGGELRVPVPAGGAAQPQPSESPPA